MNTEIERIQNQLGNLREKIDESRRDLIYEVERLLSTITDIFGGIDSEADDLSNEVDDLQERIERLEE